MSQTGEDCIQITEVNLESLCSPRLFDQDSKLAELQDKHLSLQHTLEDPNPFGLQTSVHHNVTTCDSLLNNKENSQSLENRSDQDTLCVLRRSSRLKAGRDAKHTDDMYKMPEKILQKILVCEDQTNKKSSTKNFRMQDPALMIKGKRKNMHSARLKSGKQIRKNRKLAGKNDSTYTCLNNPENRQRISRTESPEPSADERPTEEGRKGGEAVRAPRTGGRELGRRGGPPAKQSP
uniref:ankyrin repeat domain-containing protein 31-like n=1 Tax=Panthera onca TaxID=9690 RepID=UPI002954BC8A|nr:ankyrin repeat domain-containing protein 31-like [Panthera onca]